MKRSVVLISLGLSLPCAVLADCPSNMNADQLVECITVEGSGANYQNWQKKHESLAGASSTSPITGEDIATVAPAAGKVAE
ncbi:MAG: hypothetical protein OQK76_01850 [Gammaproteobacteria bacterium]|nr:hypothetical protein [Gammaproteobacteria bacterium]MCW8909340.1 hypothetical protein [Gammaproteobacteria bacterium]MCW9005854.1 hypothetical protein [Gammaproteobacteria bacterium]MCW9055340.1 hypothetical protein [Gammaproteobacteria bacterium]